MQKIFTKLNEALASAKALLHASRHVAESDSVALQQHRICAALESSVKEQNVLFCSSVIVLFHKCMCDIFSIDIVNF